MYYKTTYVVAGLQLLSNQQLESTNCAGIEACNVQHLVAKIYSFNISHSVRLLHTVST